MDLQRPSSTSLYSFVCCVPSCVGRQAADTDAGVLSVGLAVVNALGVFFSCGACLRRLSVRCSDKFVLCLLLLVWSWCPSIFPSLRFLVCSEGGLFKARLSFPADYPFMPPTMKFETYMWHPNVYKDGRVCISILHPPGNDPAQYELASERWSPVHTVETILLSVISMLASPNDESAANLDAAKEWRDTPDVFKRKVREAVRRAQEDWG